MATEAEKANAWRELIEPEAMASQCGDVMSLQISLAISQKRLADANLRIAMQLESWTWQGTLATTPFSGGN